MWSLKYERQVFDYLKYIHQRVNKNFNIDLKNLPIRVNHNDLSLDNIIASSKGLKIIDNEFLGCNTGWVLNIKNSFLKEDFIYQNYIPTKTLYVLWNTRREWSKIKLKNSKSKKRIFKNLIKNLIKKII
jgi:thiamine kinase-like enzyme